MWPARMVGKITIILSVTSLVLSAATPKFDSEDKKSRVIKNDLSDEPHYADSDDHNLDYDHEAFLGEDEARTFDQLTPEESKQRLSIIVDKIDLDNDTKITEKELKSWIEYTQKRYIHEDVKRQWDSHNPKNNDKIAWAEYKDVVYGFMDNMDAEDSEEEMTYAQMVSRDERRWNRADQDSDGLLNMEEFTDFLHPEEAAHMIDVVILETIEDVDKDGDGKISLEEYIGDMFKGEDSEEPSWVSSEREQFKEFRDKNSDGYLDKEEVKAWIIPMDYNHAEAEAKHLFHESDANEDKHLTKDEILEKYDLFVGSQATDFGEALARHDEF